VAELRHATLDTKVGTIEMHRGGEGGPCPVVYLHSATGESAGVAFLEQLADSRVVIAPVFPGFGASVGLEHIDDIEDASFHVLDLIERMGFERVDLVGMSLGGWMCAELAVRWPERVRRMALINAVGLYVEGSPITEIFGRRLDELAGELFADPDFPAAQMMRELAKLENDPSTLPFELVKPVIQAQAATAKIGWNPYMHDPKLRPRLERITAPTLVVHGMSDGIVPRAHAEAYAQGLTDSRIADVENAAHLCAIECPEEVGLLVSAFLDE
jgi:2-hydroxy-6-oxonona-2,4-dienedioate hydrolase